MIEVFVEYAAIDQFAIEQFYGKDLGWRVGESGHLSIGEYVQSDWGIGVEAIKTYAPGKWRWVREVKSDVGD